MITPERLEEVERRFEAHFFATRRQQAAYNNDPVTHLHLKAVRQVFMATEHALEAEGLDEPARDRVMFRLLYGEEPGAYEPVDFGAAEKRIADRHAAVLRAMETPSVRKWQRP